MTGVRLSIEPELSRSTSFPPAPANPLCGAAGVPRAERLAQPGPSPAPPAPWRRRGRPRPGSGAAAGRKRPRSAATRPRGNRGRAPAPPPHPRVDLGRRAGAPPPPPDLRHRPRPDPHHVALDRREAVVGQPVLLGDVADHLAEHPPRARRARLLQQRLEPDLPLRLPPAMLARDLVDPPLQRLAQPEVVAVQRQHRARQHRAVDPVRERHRDQDHPPAPRLPQDLPAVDQPEAARRSRSPPVSMLVTIRVPDSRSKASRSRR